MTSDAFTPTQQAILRVLADGEPHDLEDLRACLPDDQGEEKNVHPHLSAIRKMLRPRGQDIICQVVNRQYRYRWIRLISTGTS